MEGEYFVIIGVSLFVLFVVCIGIYFIFIKPSKSTTASTATPSNTSESFEAFEYLKPNPKGDFVITNYLRKPIRLTFMGIKKDGIATQPQINLIEHMNPNSILKFNYKSLAKYFVLGNKINVYVIDELDKPTLFGTYQFKTPKDTMIKSLFIGMITSRWVGATQDSMAIPGNAIQGRPWIKIHNLTNQCLQLNENVFVPANSIKLYKGRDHFGVRLGTVFKNPDGLFPDFIFSIPATDVYYGVVSDIQQSLFGGFQFDMELDTAAEEPQFLLQNGWMGGPAIGNIEPGYLPIEGNTNIPMENRWGEKIKII